MACLDAWNCTVESIHEESSFAQRTPNTLESHEHSRHLNKPSQQTLQNIMKPPCKVLIEEDRKNIRTNSKPWGTKRRKDYNYNGMNKRLDFELHSVQGMVSHLFQGNMCTSTWYDTWKHFNTESIIEIN